MLVRHLTMRHLSRPPSVASNHSRTPSPRSSSDALPKTFPSHTEWESWKDTIGELYIERNMTLSRLKDHMAHEHGFIATDHEYKRRLNKWRFRKNYTSAEKEAVAVHLETMNTQHQTTSSEPEFLLNDRPLRMDKIERHRKAARRQSSKPVALHLNPDPRAASPYAAPFQGEPNVALEQQMSQRMATPPVAPYAYPVTSNPDPVQWNVLPYDHSQRDVMMATPGPQIGPQDQVFILIYNIVKAVHAFAEGDSARAGQIWHQCSSAVKDLIHTETLSFLIYVTLLQTLPAWDNTRCRDLYRMVYGFFAGMSEGVLKSWHPVTAFLQNATDFNNRHEAADAACHLILELVAQQSDVVQPLSSSLGGIMLNSQGELSLKILQPGSLRVRSGTPGAQAHSIIMHSLSEMMQIFRHTWYPQDLQNSVSEASVISKRKKAVEKVAGRLVGQLGASALHLPGMSSGMGHGMTLVHGAEMTTGMTNMSLQPSGSRLEGSRYLNMTESMSEMNMQLDSLPEFPPGGS